MMTTEHVVKKSNPPVEQPDPPRIYFDHLPSYQFYESLKKDENEQKYSEYITELNDLVTKHSWLSDLFKKLTRNISMVNDNSDEDKEFTKKHCYDINHWLYEQVYNNLQAKGKLGETKNIISKLQDVWKNISEKVFKGREYVCNPDEKLFSNMSYLQELKDLFDFFEDFGTMRKEIIANVYTSCDKYREYLRQRIPVYYTWRDSCKIDEYACKRYIDNYMKYRPSSMTISLGLSVILTYSKHPCLNDVYRVFVRAKEKPKRNDSLYEDLMYRSEAEDSEENLFAAKAEDALPGSRLYIK